MKRLVVENKDDGKKLSTYLTGIYPKLNINVVYKTLRKKDIKVNGKRINDNVILSAGDILEVYITDDILEGIKKNLDIPVVYEDGNIVVFNKPKDIEVEGENSLTQIMGKKYDYLRACHRIDRNTIGLVMFAKNEETLNEMFERFANGEIEKHYIACCYGIPKKDATLNAYLFKDSKKAIVYISKEPKKGASKIQTSYKLLEENKDKNLSLLDVTLHTGKTHQIRAHLAYAGLPVLGDGKYGSYEINKRFKVYTQALCSYSITLPNGTEIKLKKIPFKEYLDD